ncbi:MAG: ATP-binding cassette domain-containing protein [Candidatus Aminicenantes bacterium]|nr:ATP-binding cassette domain-containing protein [Candidatus Aminicenantes bacterium]NIM83481.1 ATP-binding cassette domain-containing protein [Candidatus Aminicenantes bacterium]NIN22873.1 ATP-binding cassette domain-containing protein [Candidatus Aminicenantes bacterium]NIN46609.1 ATP-binding cassette domain-containing protein [Candidatus Aminicenantes bacterium]NIN89512.1 ATP-binding cassette domain-containing protein [Candidatus Aminicenantes bacterium]
MEIRVKGAKEHNLKNIDITLGSGLTVVTGVSGSGKTSLVFDTLFHESRRRFQEIFVFGSPGSRVPPAKVESITGLGPAAAVGQNLLNRNPNSTLSTASGLHPFLRLLYARFGERYCRKCGTYLSVLSEDEIAEKIETLSKETPINIYAPILNQALGSHSTLLRLLSSEFGPGSLLVDGKYWGKNKLDPNIPHRIEIEVAQAEKDHFSLRRIREAVGTVKALGAHAVLLRSEKGKFSLSSAPVCPQCGIWFQVLEPKHFNQACPYCQGKGCLECVETGLYPEAASVRWEGLRFPELLGKSVEEVQALFQTSSLPSSAHRLLEEIEKRLEALVRVGLGYISLDRPSPTLSRGESQRVRLAVALSGRLEDILYVLDEPTIGQHPADVNRLIPAFRELAGPVVYVEHDRAAAAFADQVIDMGPGAGTQGGQVIFTGTPAELWRADTPSARYFSLRNRVQLPGSAPPARTFLSIQGAFLHNLREVEIKIPLGRLTVVTGVSGSGKSTLVEDVLVATLDQKKPVGCKTFEGTWIKAVLVDQGPIGKNPRSTPATYTKLADIIRDLYAEITGLSSSHFSFNRPEGACPTCQGMGAVEIRMKYLPSTWITCAHCGGLRFKDEVLEKKLKFGDQELSISDFYQLPVNESLHILREAPLKQRFRKEAEGILEALLDIGLGYLPLGQPSPTLSGGEAQRVKLAKYLGKRNLSDKIIVLDEPTTGLHPRDLAGLLRVLEKLVKAGAAIVVVEHNPDVIRAADWIIDLGPGAGPRGGKVIYMGSPDGLLKSKVSITAQALREESEIIPNDSDERAFLSSPFIKVREARANNLKHIDVDFPKNSLTVVTGVSGSGKSSLVGDVLETEARRRFLETLSLYERQGLKEGPEAPADSVSGLGVCLSVTPDRKLYDQRSTVGTATECWHHLAILLSTLGKRTCLECGSRMTRGEQWSCSRCGATAPIAPPTRFSPTHYAVACTTCQGIGTLQVPRPEKLIRNPQKPLCGGAMYSPGFFPKGYLCKPGNGGYDIVRAFAHRHGFDPEATPWKQISPDVREMFLFGDPEPLEVTFRNPRGITHTTTVNFKGFYGWIRDWDVGGTYTDAAICPGCSGARLRPQYLAVTLQGLNIHQLSELPLARLREILEPLSVTGNRPEARSIYTLKKRLGFLSQVGLGYLHLNRVSATLSAGEAQRVKIAGLLGSGLTSLTVLLDEPTRGLHPGEVKVLLGALKELRDEGSTVIVVEHDLGIIREADHIIDMGPSAGIAGGRIAAQGTPTEVSGKNTITGTWLRGEGKSWTRNDRRKPGDWLIIKGARENNLKGETIHIPRGVLAGICGVSGSGKSTLLIDTLARVLAPVKHTTSVAREPMEPGKHDEIIGIPPGTLWVDQGKKGVRNPLTFLELVQPLIKLYADSEDARALGLDVNTLGKQCSVCRGSGLLQMDMGFLPDIRSECETCEGTGYAREIRNVKLHGYSLPQLTRLTINEVYRLLSRHEKIAGPLEAARDVGLGYLVLRQPGITLSGGEIQRLKIAKELCKKTKNETLYILDEPTVGQHLEDVSRLSRVLHRLVDEGNSVIIIEHHPHLLAACDWLLELGPGGGPEGGKVIAFGPPETIAKMNTPTAPYIKEVLEADQ